MEESTSPAAKASSESAPPSDADSNPPTGVLTAAEQRGLGEWDERRVLALREESEDELLAEHLSILQNAAAFKDIDFDVTECPPEWIEKYGEEVARIRFRLAKMAQMSASDAPMGLSISLKVVQSVMKIKAARQQQPQLNVAVKVEVGKEKPVYEVLDLDE